MTTASPRPLRRPVFVSWRLLAAGLALSSALTAHAQLNITRQPEALVVSSGQTATFSVGVTASPTPTYQWRRYGYPIPGATLATLALSSVSQFENDYYDVVISSGGTTAVSQSARLLVTPRAYPGAVSVDLSRSLRLDGPENVGALGPAFAQAALPDGRFYLAGTFSSIDGQNRRDVARFNANGSLDTTFVPPAFDVAPTALAVQADGKLILIGTFKTVGGAESSGIVRLNSDGSRDTTFLVGSGFSAGGIGGKVTVMPDGNIYISDTFIRSYQGSSFLGYIIRLKPDGTLDPTFTSPAFTLGAGGINPNGFVFGPSGEIYVYGGFDAVGGVARNRLARLRSNGQIDPDFNPGTGPNNWVYAITVLRSGQLVIGGDFTAYNGTAVGHIARLNLNGTLDTTFATGSGFSQQVGFVAELPGNALFVGSAYNSYKGVVVAAGVRLTANGTLDTTFVYPLSGRPDSLSLLAGNRLLLSGSLLSDLRPGVRVLEATGGVATSVTVPGIRYPARARLLAPLPGGKVFVAGNFTYANGTPAPYVMRLNADLTRDPTFPAGPGPGSQVTGGFVQPDGKILLFTYNGTVRLNADGSNDASIVSQSLGGFWYGVSSVVLRDGRVLVPTDAPSWGNGTAVTNGMVILEPNGTRVTSHPFLPGPNTGARITGLQRLPGGQILVVGTFTSWSGVPRANAVRLNADGSVDNTFVPDGSLAFTSFSYPLSRTGWSIQRDGKLILAMEGGAGGTFVRLGLNGARDATFTSGLPRLSSAGSFFVQPDDRIVIVAQGEARASDGNLDTLFFRLQANGALDTTFAVRGSRYWGAAMVADNGELLSSDDTGYLHRYASLPAPTITAPPTAQSIVAGTNILLRVTATGDEPLSYQWLKDGVPLAGATLPTLALDNATTAVAGNYAVTVTNAGGSVTSSTAAVSVTARPAAGVTFGTIGGSAGTFALLVRADGTGAFLGYLREARVVWVARHFTVGPDRRFRFLAVPGNNSAASEVEGAIAADGSVSATLSGRPLAAPPATTSGATIAFVGFYETGETNGANLGYTIIGANSQAYTVAIGTGLAEAGSVTVDASGNLNGTTETGALVTGGIQAATGLATTTFVRSARPPLALAGADNEKRNDVEKLVNLSTRSTIGPGGSFTAGFVVGGTRAKPVLIRGIGPTLGAFQVPGALPAAQLEVFRGATSIAVGRDWGLSADTARLTATAVRVGAFALPATSRDAALYLVLEPGNYSAKVTGQDGATGAALIEIYDATEGPIPRRERIVNVSTLAVAGSGAEALTAGFFVAGLVPKRLLLRGAGPALAQFGVGSVLTRPQVAVYSGTTVLVQNAGWSTSPDAAAIAAAAAQVQAFAFPADSADAAVVVNLAPGSYSVQVSGLGGTSGTALVEVYELP